MIKHQISKGRQLSNASNQIHTLWNEVLRWCQLTHESKFTKSLRKYIGLRNDQKSLRRKLVTIFPVQWRLEWWEAIQNQPIAKFLTIFALLGYQISIRSKCEDTASYGQHLGGPCARDKENGVFLNITFLRGASTDKCTSKLLKRFIKKNARWLPRWYDVIWMAFWNPKVSNRILLNWKLIYEMLESYFELQIKIWKRTWSSQ